MKNEFILKTEDKTWKIKNEIFSKHTEIQKYHPSKKHTFSLLPKFLLDVEDWYSITPVEITEQFIKTAIRSASQALITPKTILCAYSGAGGDALVFLKHNFNVIANDIDYQKIKYLKFNKKILEENCKCVGNLQCIVKDFFELEKSEFVEKPFVAFVSPPWGGVDYREIGDIGKSMGIGDIRDKIKSIVDNVCYFLPRSMDCEQLKKLFGVCKIQKAVLKGKLQGFLVYTGPLFN